MDSTLSIMTGSDSTALNEQLDTLLTKCTQSNEIALADLFNLTSAKLFAIQERMLGNSADAERALHATYNQIWSEVHYYSSQMGRPMNWITGLARQQALRILNEQRSNDGQPNAFTLGNDGHLTNLDFLSEHPDAQQLNEGLSQLDCVQRDCIARAYLDGASVSELSELHNSSEDHVRRWLQQGMLKLRGHIDAHG